MPSCKAGSWAQRSWWSRYTHWMKKMVPEFWLPFKGRGENQKVKARNCISSRNERIDLFLGAVPCFLDCFCQPDLVSSSGWQALSSTSVLAGSWFMLSFPVQGPGRARSFHWTKGMRREDSSSSSPQKSYIMSRCVSWLFCCCVFLVYGLSRKLANPFALLSCAHADAGIYLHDVIFGQSIPSPSFCRLSGSAWCMCAGEEKYKLPR